MSNKFLIVLYVFCELYFGGSLTLWGQTKLPESEALVLYANIAKNPKKFGSCKLVPNFTINEENHSHVVLEFNRPAVCDQQSTISVSWRSTSVCSIAPDRQKEHEAKHCPNLKGPELTRCSQRWQKIIVARGLDQYMREGHCRAGNIDPSTVLPINYAGSKEKPRVFKLCRDGQAIGSTITFLPDGEHVIATNFYNVPNQQLRIFRNGNYVFKIPKLNLFIFPLTAQTFSYRYFGDRTGRYLKEQHLSCSN